jgi:hypothetical protein
MAFAEIIEETRELPANPTDSTEPAMDIMHFAMAYKHRPECNTVCSGITFPTTGNCAITVSKLPGNAALCPVADMERRSVASNMSPAWKYASTTLLVFPLVPDRYGAVTWPSPDKKIEYWIYSPCLSSMKSRHTSSIQCHSPALPTLDQ